MPDSAVRRAHEMPFGAACESGVVRFRLWAPAAQRVELLLGEPVTHRLDMTAEEGGWFELVTTDASRGSLYRFRLADGLAVPDPASRQQLRDVHGPSRVVDPTAFVWSDGSWRGRPWEEAVLYELHVGSFSIQGNFDGVRDRLDHLASVGVTAVELMPIADFPGGRNWGYDGVLPFAPDVCYGGPDELKRLIDAAHERGLMVLLDVVYNHFGPEGNYLHRYAPQFFRSDRKTPWGDAIDFAGDHSRTVRSFFVHNALYWLEEFHIDGLRLDAVHAIFDESTPDFLDELAAAVRRGPGAERHVHLVLENVANEAHRLERDVDGSVRSFTAQWNDDVHHALHCQLTGEAEGYYADFADAPRRHLARGLAEGFAYQGERSRYFGGRARGEPSVGLPPTSFVNFLQNHDQIGNRAFGERIHCLVDERPLRAATSVLLLAPAPPLLFMGQEWGCRQPFPFFCDFEPELAQAVTDGRRREFARFAEFADPTVRSRIPDPGAEATFRTAVLDWSALDRSEHRRWLEFVRELLELRARHLVPWLRSARATEWRKLGESALQIGWELADGAAWTLLANLGPAPATGIERPPGREIHQVDHGLDEGTAALRLAPWTAHWLLDGRP